MMFNGLLCADSDGSDLTKGSGGTPRRGASDDVDYYREKLRATTLILRNKEETVRVQNESLLVAATRLDALTTRVAQLQRDLDRRTQELLQLRQSADGESQVKIDTSAETLAQENEKQRKMVKALSGNLSVIQEMYRECFYEAAQQESLIESLRDALYELRQAEGDKKGTLQRLKDIVDLQRGEIRRCQDIAMDVENLKSEIFSFLNSSNNDSGVWEEASGADAGEELRDIATQLLRLQELLQEDCSCAARLDTQSLKEQNATLERETHDLQARVVEAQTALSAKDNRLRDLREQLADKHKELQEARQKLSAAEAAAAVAQALLTDHKEQCRCLQSQLSNTQGLLEDKSEELARARQQCEEFDRTIQELRGELHQVHSLLKESSRGPEAKGCSRCAELQTQLDQTKELLATKTGECRAHESTIKELKQETGHLQGMMSQFQNMKQKLLAREGSARQQLSAKECSSLQDRLNEATALLATRAGELSATQQQCRALQLQLDTLRADLHRAERNVDKLQGIEEKLKLEHSAELAEERRGKDLLRENLETALGQVESKSQELQACAAQRRQHEETIKKLKEELDKANRIIKSDSKVRSEVSYLSQQVALWRRQLGDSAGRVTQLEAELAAARRATAELEAYCSSQTSAARRLEAELCDATARGAELCGESRRVLAAVRDWVRAQHAEYQKKFSEQERYAAHLLRRLEQYEQQDACGRALLVTPGSSRGVCAAPVPPRRTKTHRCRCQTPRACATQQPERTAARCGLSPCASPRASPAPHPAETSAGPAPPPPCRACTLDLESATELLFSRVETLQRASLAGQRRWLARAPHHQPASSRPL